MSGKADTAEPIGYFTVNGVAYWHFGNLVMRVDSMKDARYT